MMMTHDTRSRLLDLVMARIGRMETASCLEVECELLDRWASGAMLMPDDKLLALIDLVDRAARH
jgi:hypothetical protein